MSLILAVLTEHGFVFDKEIPETDKWHPIKCAYHGEDRASAAVNPVAGAYICHACGTKGNAFTLVKERGGFDFGGTRKELERIAVEYGTELPQPTKRQPRRYGVLGRPGTDRGNGKTVRPRFRG